MNEEEQFEQKPETEQTQKVSLEKEAETQQNTTMQQEGFYQEEQPKMQGSGTNPYPANEPGWTNPYPYNNYYGNNYYQQPEEEKSNSGFAIASFVLGIVSLLLFCCCANVVTAILAIIFGIIHLVSGKQKKGMAVAGILCAVLSIACTVVYWVMVIQSPVYRNTLSIDPFTAVESDESGKLFFYDKTF